MELHNTLFVKFFMHTGHSCLSGGFEFTSSDNVSAGSVAVKEEHS